MVLFEPAGYAQDPAFIDFIQRDVGHGLRITKGPWVSTKLSDAVHVAFVLFSRVVGAPAPHAFDVGCCRSDQARLVPLLFKNSLACYGQPLR
ncbi:MAG: hypothetical protein JWP57_2629 [Spirosoma sp.]|nr:hypothetical protein [Spirosoma sp.]